MLVREIEGLKRKIEELDNEFCSNDFQKGQINMDNLLDSKEKQRLYLMKEARVFEIVERKQEVDFLKDKGLKESLWSEWFEVADVKFSDVQEEEVQVSVDEAFEGKDFLLTEN